MHLLYLFHFSRNKQVRSYVQEFIDRIPCNLNKIAFLPFHLESLNDHHQHSNRDLIAYKSHMLMKNNSTRKRCRLFLVFLTKL